LILLLAVTVLAVQHRTAPVSGVRQRSGAPLDVKGAIAPALHGAPGPTLLVTPPFSTTWLQQTSSPQLGFQGASGVLVDIDDRAVLWERDAHAARAPASLAKIMTAMVAADLAPLDRQVRVPAEAAAVEADSTVMGLSAGEVVTLRDLMYGVFLSSGNDAAETLAGSLTDRHHFIDLMNRKAADLGMVDSHFTNPTGLDDPAMRTTAYDLAVASATLAADYPELLAVAGSRQMALAAGAGHKAFDLHALNRLVGLYPGATGLKTGYTGDAGYCLVGTATRGDRHLVAVVMGDGLTLTADAVKLLDYGFSVTPTPIPEGVWRTA
jgi:serine-type D-Ala-D-Ala carboxypeptidase (penicillin-binding protein 5/6)